MLRRATRGVTPLGSFTGCRLEARCLGFGEGLRLRPRTTLRGMGNDPSRHPAFGRLQPRIIQAEANGRQIVRPNLGVEIEPVDKASQASRVSGSGSAARAFCYDEQVPV